jgi:tRNA nucleotidyltransferase/poly(A) polymerase
MTPEQILQKLLDAGYKTYFVGGCVRDSMLNRTPKDWDIATDATPDQVQKLFEGQEVKAVGAHFGVILVDNIEVATFRSDHAYHDGRRPEGVTYETDPAKDAQRRDFTINALFMDKNHEIIDFVNGQRDIYDRVIRAVGNPEDRFVEDRLRMLRAVRFASRFRFGIEDVTFAAIKQSAKHIGEISAERIQIELVKILSGTDVDWGFGLLFDSGLLFALTSKYMPLPIFHDSRRIIMAFLRANSEISYTTSLAIIFGQKAEQFMLDMKFSNADIEQTKSLVEFDIAAIPSMSVANQKRKLRHKNFWEALKIFEAQGTVHDVGYPSSLRSLHQFYVRTLNPEPLLNGKDLIEMGLTPGPKFAEILRELETGQLEDRISTKEQAKEFVRKYGN